MTYVTKEFWKEFFAETASVPVDRTLPPAANTPLNGPKDKTIKGGGLGAHS